MAQKRKAADAELEDSSPASKRPTNITLGYPSLARPPLKPPPFQQPTQLLSFSYTPDHVLEFDNSALRYYTDPPLGADLGYGYDRWIRRPDERGRLDTLLQAWSRFKKSLSEGPSSNKAPDIHVVSWRGIMTKILMAPYEERDSWELNVMRVGGTFYFEEHLSDAKLKEKNDMEPRQRRQTYHGYAFESYCTTSTPGRRENTSSHVQGWGGDVNTNVQWCSIVKTKLGDRRIIIGGEVDCVRGKYSGNTTNFVELKTSLTIRGPSDETKFEKKLLKFYLQSFLLGVPEIVVGFRKPSGQLVTTQSFRTAEIPRVVRDRPGEWNPLICLEWGDTFLSFLHTTLPASTGKDVWRVTFTPKAGTSAVMLDAAGVEDVIGGDDRVGFLPQWYWDEMGPCADESDRTSSHCNENLQRPATSASGAPLG